VITVHGLHHVKVPVSDLTRSRAWYETVLSLSLHLEFPDDSGTVPPASTQQVCNAISLNLSALTKAAGSPNDRP
jgi:Glyoxalase/Bleomycin resistance protein/Dioxygenase superfamily